ncbi:hypothetical protein [Zavarzinia sp. CC-PAN008]|uniref:hypothetical protein n=1 Tax=Zavarzinia sp. CC-PAN008 TaxID=3243332 RepID=UPI003F74555B
MTTLPLAWAIRRDAALLFLLPCGLALLAVLMRSAIAPASKMDNFVPGAGKVEADPLPQPPLTHGDSFSIGHGLYATGPGD